MYCYNIGNIGFCFRTERKIIETELYDRFRIDYSDFCLLNKKHIFTVLDESVILPQYGIPVLRCSSYTVYKNEDCYLKVTNRYNRREYKAICRQNGEGGEIFFTDSSDDSIETSAELFRIIDIATALLFYDAVIMHGSVIEYDGKALVFSGDSGVGKSTQADLWKKCAGTKILNGDRVVLRRADGRWYACGIPMCGSSEYCEQFMLELSTIVFLGQAQICSASDMSAAESILGLSSQINCGSRKPDESEKFLMLTEDLINNIKIIRYNCTPDEVAVRYLQGYLERK